MVHERDEARAQVILPFEFGDSKACIGLAQVTVKHFGRVDSLLIMLANLRVMIFQRLRSIILIGLCV